MQSVEKPAPGSLIFSISHRFGPINQGAYELWGLDQATMRLGFEYGIHRLLSLNIGRSTYQKTYDGALKFSLMRQSSGKKHHPVSIVYYTGVAINSLKWENPERTNFFSSRLAYTHQLIVGRKFNEKLSLQIAPTLIHRNLVQTSTDRNIFPAVGFGGRYKLGTRLSINGEYFYRIPPEKSSQDFKNNYNSLSLGVDIETGGHVFQLHVTNSLPMIEKGFIAETNERWEEGGLHFGFNLTRTFSLSGKKEQW